MHKLVLHVSTDDDVCEARVDCLDDVFESQQPVIYCLDDNRDTVAIRCCSNARGEGIMRGTPINQEMLVGNTCFGCSLTNTEGLQIRIYRDGDSLDRLVGEYAPRNTQESLPGIVHGGIQFSALDCMAGWIVFGLRCAERKMPVTLNASIRYRRPAKIHQPLSLLAEVVSTEMVGEGPKAKELIRIHTEARDNENELISAAEFEYIAMPEAQFCTIVGLERLSDAYQKHFAGSQKTS